MEPVTKLSSPHDREYINSYNISDSNIIRFQWQRVLVAEKYQFQLAYDVNFSELVIPTVETKKNELEIEKSRFDSWGENTYYWRVRATHGEYDEVFYFHYLSNDTLYVSNALNNTTQYGTKNNPFKTIQSAIDKARELGINRIHVANGTYSDDDLITIRNYLELTGGYDPITWLATNDRTKTVINSVIFTFNLKAGSSLECFTINGNRRIIQLNESKVEISNVYLTSTVEQDIEQINGLITTGNSEVKLDDCTLELTQDVPAKKYGFMIGGQTDFILENSSVNVSYGESVTGIFLWEQAKGTIINNPEIITSSSTTDARTINIQHQSSADITNNNIYSKYNVTETGTILMFSESSAIIKDNPVISAEGPSDEVYTIHIQDNSVAEIENNNIYALNGFSDVSCIAVLDDAIVEIKNNPEIRAENSDNYLHTIFVSNNGRATIEENSIFSKDCKYCYAIASNITSSTSIRNNVLIKGEAPATDLRVIGLTDNAETSIENNTIIGEYATDYLATISIGKGDVDAYCSATIINNPEVIAGSSGNWAIAIEVGGSNTCTVKDNKLSAEGRADYTNGIYVWDNAYLLAENNYIFAKNASNIAGGIEAVDNCSGVIRNNHIISAEGSTNDANGVIIEVNASVIVTNNNIKGGDVDCTYSTGITLNDNNELSSIINNIIFTTGGDTKYGVFEYNTSSDPLRFMNNLIFNVSNLYYDEGNLNVNPVTTDVAPTCSGNLVNVNPNFISLFPDTADYHLQSSSPSTVKYGGLYTCDNDDLGDVCDDADEKLRTDPVSIGAYEMD